MRAVIAIVIIAVAAGLAWQMWGASPEQKPGAPTSKPGASPALAQAPAPQAPATPPPAAPAPAAPAEPKSDSPPGANPFILAQEGDSLAAKGDKEGARAQYAAAYKRPGADRATLVRKMIELNQELLFSKKATKDSVVHIVQSGDNPTTIGKKYRIDPQGLMRINGLKKPTIFPGDKLKVPTGTFRIDVSKSSRQLLLFYDDSAAKQYPVAIGKEGHDTPTGEFTISKKEFQPNWTKTHGDGRKEVVAFGAPGHMLGTRWLGFSEPHTDIGIHGTPKEEEGNVGGAVSMGCIRLKNADVEELYDLVTKGTKVLVTE